MGDTSIIARRLQDGHIQFGWSGNSGYFRSVGVVLLTDYNTPEKVEYLFGLGQLSSIWHPKTELTNDEIRTKPTGKPHYLTDSEEKIFRQILFVDYAYFYDADQTWYYINPGFFTTKIRLEDVWHYIEQTGNQFEFTFIHQIEGCILREILGSWYSKDPGFRRYANLYGLDDVLDRKSLEELDELLHPDDDDMESGYALADYVYDFYRGYKQLFDYFDRWVVVKPVKGLQIGKILVRKREKKHLETIEWGK